MPYDHLINLWGTGSRSAQMANEAKMSVEESWTVRTRKYGGRGWCGSALSKFLRCYGAAFLLATQDFRSMLDNFTPLASVLCRYSWLLGGETERFHGDLQCLLEVLFSGFLGNSCPGIVLRRAVSSWGGDLSCGTTCPTQWSIYTSTRICIILLICFLTILFDCYQ